ncbi:hypothetical protein EV132_10871 [Rhizobium sullae]|uniref:Uncharacterized protein n=1 Tax=Rhizobium sullae TaxID=50338 RepID=A0A4R3Q0Z8_RHISU|nr:hypothetical protein EV132_10871 [Rhizobium sullae]
MAKQRWSPLKVLMLPFYVFRIVTGEKRFIEIRLDSTPGANPCASRFMRRSGPIRSFPLSALTQHSCLS